MQNNLSVIILAAGKGTRMKSKILKPLHKVANLEMVNHVIKTAETLNAQEIIIVLGEENINEVKSNISTNIKTVLQTDRNGTGGATKVGLTQINNINNNILIMFGDVPMIKKDTYQSMIDKLTTDNVITILGFNVQDINKKYGRLIINNDNNELEKIIEYKDANIEQKNIRLCNAGIFAVKGPLLKQFLDELNNNNASGEYYLTDIVEIAKKYNYKCNFSVAVEDEVMGVNSREELSIAESIFQKNKRKEFMDKGITLIDPNTVYFSYDTEIENDVVIEPNVYFGPKVKIHNDVTIKANSYLENCEIKQNAIIGPFARIRPETIIEENVHIGNFCEIKKSIINKNTKIGHLTYIGDSTIGENTNIGGGTITCNYDGYSKFKTKIGNNVFVGSHTTFIAPVEIGDNAITAAGTVVTTNIESDALAIARVEQKNILNAAIKYRNKRKEKK